MTLWLLTVLAALFLAFANGANDNSKGVATLIGSGLLDVRGGVRYAAVATLAGSIVAIWIGAELAASFKGRGIVDAELLTSPAFAASVGLGAATTVLLATRLGMPISTTHALVGTIVGIGAASQSLYWSAVWSKFFYPLLASPLLAVVLAGAGYLLFCAGDRYLKLTSSACVCVSCRKTALIGLAPLHSEAAVLDASPAVLVEIDSSKNCTRRGLAKVVDVPAVLGWLHIVSAGALSFARGLNDTPKIAALTLALAPMAPATTPSLSSAGWIVFIGLAIVLGGLIAVRRVADTMAFRITGMSDGQALTSNLVSSTLVIFASRLGLPVSTTHVSCGSLFGIGLVGGQARWPAVASVIASWILTLPAAALLGGGTYLLLTKFS